MVLTRPLQIVYFGRSIPWIIADAMPYFRKWKLQPNKIPTAKEQWECTKLVLFSHFTIELPTVSALYECNVVTYQTYILLNRSGCSTLWQNLLECPHTRSRCPIGRPWLPKSRSSFSSRTFSTSLVRQSVFRQNKVLIGFSTAHQMLHKGVLYKHIHKIHHKYSAPFGLAAEYAHPAEVMILGTGTILGPLLYCYFTRNFHIFTMYVWITLRLFQAIDAHSGYGMSIHSF